MIIRSQLLSRRLSHTKDLPEYSPYKSYIFCIVLTVFKIIVFICQWLYAAWQFVYLVIKHLTVKLYKMKTIYLLAASILFTITAATAQIKNPTTDTVKIYGNCGMCKTKIEKAATQKNISTAVWNEETGMATITYDATKTTKDDILKKIASVGYDSDAFKATDGVYNKLPGCCQYDRPKTENVKAGN